MRFTQKSPGFPGYLFEYASPFRTRIFTARRWSSQGLARCLAGLSHRAGSDLPSLPTRTTQIMRPRDLTAMGRPPDRRDQRDDDEHERVIANPQAYPHAAAAAACGKSSASTRIRSALAPWSLGLNIR
jgi:hypothetical protein